MPFWLFRLALREARQGYPRSAPGWGWVLVALLVLWALAR